MKTYLLSTAAIVALAGCSVNVDPVDQKALQDAATQELAAMFPAAQEIQGPLDLDEVVQRALTNNLDTRLKKMETVFSRSRLNVDKLSMLPVIAANAGYSARNEASYSTSQVSGSNAPTGSYSTSGEASVSNADLTVTWNVLDLAVGYYNAKQSADRAMISVERERRAVLDLIQTSKEAFWRAYAAERLTSRVAANIAKADRALRKIESGRANGAIAPMDALRQRKSVLESVRQLELLKQGLDVASIELSQMINARPGADFDLKSAKMTIPNIGKSLKQLEEQAFLNSPDVREQAYRSRIAISDVKKASVDLFPQLSATASLQYSTNDFLLSNDWNQYGLNVGWNLLRLATAPQRMDNARSGAEVERARALAVRMAVLAKTHIAYREYLYAVQQFKRESDLFRIESELARENRNRSEASVGNEIDTIVSETSAMMAEMRRYRAYAQVVSAAERVKSTVGDDTEVVRALSERNNRAVSASNDKTTAENVIKTQSQKVAEIDKELVSLSKARTKLETEIEKQSATVASLNAQLPSLLAALEEQSTAVSALDSASDGPVDLDAAKTAQANNRSEQRAASRALRQAKRDLATAERQSAKAERALVNATGKADGLEGDQLAAQQQKIAEATQAAANASQAVEAATAALGAQSKAVAALEVDADAIAQKIAFANARAPQAAAAGKASAKVDAARTELAAEQATLDDLKAQLEDLQAQQNAATQLREKTAATMASAQNDLADAEGLLKFYAPFTKN